MTSYIPIGVALLAAFLVSGCALLAAGAVGAGLVAHHDYCKQHHCNW